MTPTDRETWMDSLRGIAMILVVILHAGLALGFYADFYPEPIRIFNDIFEPYRMPTLMFLSGMLLTKSLQKPAGVYFAGKARRVAWPYAIWTAIILTIQGDISLDALAHGVYDPVGTHLWYLWFLLLFYVVAWVLRPIPPWIVALAALVTSVFMPADFRLDKMTFLFGFFMLGAFFAQHRAKFERWTRKPVVLMLALALAAVASSLNVLGVSVLYEPLFAVSVIGALILAMRFVPTIPDGRPRAALEYVGRNSIILYIVHLPAIKIVGTLLGKVGFDNPWLMFPILLVVGFGSGVALMLLGDRFRIFRWLFEWMPPRTKGRTKGRVAQSSGTAARIGDILT